MFFWQKKEVLVTFSLNDFNRVKDILAANQIPYDWKTVPDCGRRGRRTLGIRIGKMPMDFFCKDSIIAIRILLTAGENYGRNRKESYENHHCWLRQGRDKPC